MNSASSSRNSTPWLARLSSPGRIDAPPPPTSETIDELWCGAWNGGWATSPPRGSGTPAAECTIVTSSAWLGAQRRKQTRESGGEHRLARARRPDHQQVVATCGRDLDREPAELVPTDVDEVGAREGRLGVGLGRDGRPRRLAAQHSDELGERRRDADGAAVGEPGLGRAVGRHDEPARRHDRSEWDDAGHPPEGAVEPELGEERETLDRRRLEMAVGDQHADRDRQVEPGATFAEPGRRKVDCDPLQRPPETARQDGTSHPIARLPARSIG